MTESVLEMAKDLVSEQIKSGGIAPEYVADLLTTTHHQLLSLKSRELTHTQPHADQTETGTTDWKKSITKHAVICLECGTSFKQLSTKHLNQHDLNSRSYREKYGIPQTQSLVCQETRARRQEIVRAVRPWEKSPTNQKAQAETATKASLAPKKKPPKKASKKASRRPQQSESRTW